MALFGKADAGLPWMTQIAQLDTNDTEEVARFIRRVATRLGFNNIIENTSSSDQGASLDPNASVRNNLVMFYDKQEVEPTTIAQKILPITLHLLQKECLNIQEILSPLCDRKAINYKALRELRSNAIVASSRPEYLVLRKESINWEENLPEEVPLHSFAKLPTYEDDAAGQFLAAATEQLLLDMFDGKATLTRCVECGYPFVLIRKSQQYCSHRCANRVSQRKRDKKNSLPSNL